MTHHHGHAPIQRAFGPLSRISPFAGLPTAHNLAFTLSPRIFNLGISSSVKEMTYFVTSVQAMVQHGGVELKKGPARFVTYSLECAMYE